MIQEVRIFVRHLLHVRQRQGRHSQQILLLLIGGCSHGRCDVVTRVVGRQHVVGRLRLTVVIRRTLNCIAVVRGRNVSSGVVVVWLAAVVGVVCVTSDVFGEVVGSGEGVVAHAAGKLLLARVDPRVSR
jgi:hypothetical protein